MNTVLEQRSILRECRDACEASDVFCGNGAFSTRPVNAARAFRNVRMMRLLEKVGRAFNDRGVDVLLLKGAALNLTLYDRCDERTMDDLDLLVRPDDVDAACAALESLGGLRGKSQVREDFFPRFHYEIEYTLGHTFPVKIDLHVRPFRPLRYSQTVPDEALWADAVTIEVGAARLLHPAPDDMLIHLAAHCAVHGNGRESWLVDIARWIERYGRDIHWPRFLRKVENWRLTYAVGYALTAVRLKLGVALAPEVLDSMAKHRVGWRDRWTVLQAPHDASRPVRHVLVSALCTPRVTYVTRYLWAMVFPDRNHMADWYGRRHPGWLFAAHLLRIFGPVIARLPRVSRCWKRVEVRKSPKHGLGLFAGQCFGAGETIVRFAGRSAKGPGMYVVAQRQDQGVATYTELTGDVRFLNHSCTANARIEGRGLVATKPIPSGKEITIDYGIDACSCRERANDSLGAPGQPKPIEKEQTVT